jgi:phosphonate transport system ATP-binding protein
MPFELIDVSVGYEGQPALRGVTLRISRGEKVAVVGRSGAGKSTLLRLLLERAQTDVAFISQDYGLVKALSVFHNVYMGRLRRHGSFYNLLNLLRPIRREVEAVAPLLARFDLADKLFEPAGQLSGGQQQRTSVARALHQGATVLMADEPVSSVDEHQSRRVLEAIVSDHETTVLAMHDTGLAIEYADRVIGLTDGRITLDEATDGLRSRDLDSLYAA